MTSIGTDLCTPNFQPSGSLSLRLIGCRNRNVKLNSVDFHFVGIVSFGMM